MKILEYSSIVACPCKSDENRVLYEFDCANTELGGVWTIALCTRCDKDLHKFFKSQWAKPKNKKVVR